MSKRLIHEGGFTYVKTADQRLLAIDSVGHPDGPPLVLMHGTPGSRLLRPSARFLTLSRVHCITYDRPGFGRSTRHQGRTVADAAEDVERIMDVLGYERFGVLGQSGGGPHALAVAAKLGSRVTRAGVLVSPKPSDDTGDWLAGMAGSNREAYGAETEAVVARILERTARAQADPESVLLELEAQGELTTEDMAVLDPGDLIRSLIVRSHQEGVRQGAGGWIDDALAFRKDWGVDLSQIESPTILWAAGQDGFSPYWHSQDMAARIGDNAELRRMYNKSHFSAYLALPDMVLEIAHGP